MREIFKQPGLQHTEKLKEEIRKVISTWREKPGQRNYWGEPLVGIASADDPLFTKLREVVDPSHAVPHDLLPDARSVVAFFIPFLKEIGRENDRNGSYTARSWAEAYVTTNRLIAAVSTHLQDMFETLGYAAAITPATHNFDEEKLISGWSHKHLAYIAGLGTFGRHHLLITASGCCGRLGSLVTSMPLPVTERPAGEFCLEKAGRRCHACFAKCTYGALLEDRFDRHACYRQCLINDAYYEDLPLVDVCGKCGCEVPCSYGIPSVKE